MNQMEECRESALARYSLQLIIQDMGKMSVSFVADILTGEFQLRNSSQFLTDQTVLQGGQIGKAYNNPHSYNVFFVSVVVELLQKQGRL